MFYALCKKNNLIFDYESPARAGRRRATRSGSAVSCEEGNRIAKHIVNNTTGVIEKSTYYILDAQGQQLAMYDFYVDNPNASTDFYLTERNIYGSSRLGVNKDIINMGNPAPLPSYGMLGNRYYELKNHLGNVLTVLNDHITPIDENNDQQADAYQVGISNTYDYSPFGVQLDGRTIEIPQTETICHNETTSVTAIAFEDHFNNINGTWTAMGAANLAYLLGQMYVINTAGNNTIGASHDFTVSETSQHTVSFEIGCNTCGHFVPVFVPLGWFILTYYVYVPNTIHVSVEDALGNVVTSGNYSQTGSYTLTFTPATTGTYTINFSMNNAFYSCEFSVKETKISFTQTQTSLICDNLPSGGYRYGYQGSEKDNEVKGSGNSYTTHFRQLDPRLGRWLTIDPKATAWESPYVSMGNNPIWHNDVLGDSIQIKSYNGTKNNGSGGFDLLTYKSTEKGGIGFYTESGELYSGDSKFVKDVNRALARISLGKEGNTLVTKLMNDKTNFIIEQTTKGNQTNASNGDIAWNPNSIIGGFNQNKNRSTRPWVSLAHELGHTYSILNNVSVPEGQWDDNIEWDEINASHWENKIRSENGLPLRTYYGVYKNPVTGEESPNINTPLLFYGTDKSLYFDLQEKVNYHGLKNKENAYSY